jgi:type III secretory pathway component EscU
VALRYAPGVTPLPVVIAKGLDSRALALRREAARRGIPVLEDRPLARRLHATVKVGAAIGEEVLEPVARVIRRAMAQPLRAPSSEGVARIG